MTNLRRNRKVWAVALLILVLVMGTAVVYAANTPSWWNNPGSTYTSWNTSGQFFGNAANNSGSSQILTIENDVATCNVGEHIELWVQIAWVNTGNPNVSLRTSSAADRFIRWTTDVSGCPADVSSPLPSEDGLGFLTNELSFTPTGNSVPGGIAFDNGYERSYTFADSTATCARPSAVFDIPDGAGFEYRMEVQSVCFSPTAVSLQSIDANNASPVQLATLIGGLLLVVLGGGAFLYRRQNA